MTYIPAHAKHKLRALKGESQAAYGANRRIAPRGGRDSKALLASVKSRRHWNIPCDEGRPLRSEKHVNSKLDSHEKIRRFITHDSSKYIWLHLRLHNIPAHAGIRAGNRGGICVAFCICCGRLRCRCLALRLSFGFRFCFRLAWQYSSRIRNHHR